MLMGMPWKPDIYRRWEELFPETHSRQWPKAFRAPGLHDALLSKGLLEGVVHFSEIRIDGVPVSWELGFRDRHRAYSYMPAYLDDYAGLSPGKVHLSFLIEECFHRGLRIFDFMLGSQEYKDSWTDSSAYVHSCRMFSDSLFSRTRLFADQALNGLKKLLPSVPLVCQISPDALKKLLLLIRTQFLSYAESCCGVFVELPGIAVLG